MPHDIIDNRTRELAPEIKDFLADSIRAHFAVGYFFLSGFQAIAEHIPHLDQLRLLIGNVTNRQTIEQLAEAPITWRRHSAPSAANRCPALRLPASAPKPPTPFRPPWS